MQRSFLLHVRLHGAAAGSTAAVGKEADFLGAGVASPGKRKPGNIKTLYQYTVF
jgi:hypothetical protein